MVEHSIRVWRIAPASWWLLLALWISSLSLSLPCLSAAKHSEAVIDAGSGAVRIDDGDDSSKMNTNTNTNTNTNYGVDVSWPMQHPAAGSSSSSDDSDSDYETFMRGCYEQGYVNHEKRPDGLYQKKEPNTARAGKRETKEYVLACNAFERDRLEMNLQQPGQMQNYTHAGYAKVHTPPEVLRILETFWEQNERFVWPEFWDEGNTYVNHWKAPTSLLDIGRKDVPHPLSTHDYETIVRSVKDVLESWTNQRLVLTSAYGIRTYGEGAILAPHVDRLPLVSSAIINVVQRNVEEPWILEVIGHDGRAHNLASDPGEMILYESASVIHGRPYPLRGKGALYGSLFVHFEPLYHTLRHAERERTGEHYASTATATSASTATSTATSTSTSSAKQQASKNAFEKAFREQLKKPTLREVVDKESGNGKTTTGIDIDIDIDADAETDGTAGVPKGSGGGDKIKTKTKAAFRKAPGYVWPEYDELYDQRFYFEYEEYVYPKASKVVLGNLNSHQAASLGELSLLKEIAATQGRDQLFKADHNGWRPIHEAARSGHADVVEYLLKEGAKVNERTNYGKGGNAMHHALSKKEKNKDAIAVLMRYGGVHLEPLGNNKDKDKDKDQNKDKNNDKNNDNDNDNDGKDKDKDKADQNKEQKTSKAETADKNSKEK